MSVKTPLMGLTESTIGVDSGLAWETNLNSSLKVIDGHNHSPGNGSPISASGINVSSALPFNNNQAISLQAAVFTQQSSLGTLNALFVGTDGNLYFNDSAGDASIQITSGGAVNSTSSGISSGSATASFVSSVLVVNAASNTPANIQAGSLLIGNNSSGSKFLTLAPPTAMAANYSLTLPSLPASTNLLTCDSSGNISAAANVDNVSLQFSGTVLSIKNLGVAQAQSAIRPGPSTSSSTLGTYVRSSSSGSQTTVSTSFVTVTNLSVSLTTNGNPVFVGILPDTTGSLCTLGATGTSGTTIVGAQLEILNGLTAIASTQVFERIQSSTGVITINTPLSFFTYDFPSAGSHTYSVNFSSSSSSSTASISNAVLVVYEIK